MRSTLLAALTTAVLSVSAGADVVHLKDGRVYEGEILRQDGAAVKIDTMATPRIRAQLTFSTAEVESVEVKPVPEGFFDPPPAAPRVSKPDAFEAGANLYIEVPIIGAFGEDVFAAGIEDALHYARRHRIGHVVFTIDSDGGLLDEAGKAYRVLKKYDKAVTCHAIIKRCTGDALAIPLWCDTVRLLPNAIVGGSAAMSEETDPDQDALVRSQIAREVARDRTRSGRDSRLVTAMIDPTESLVAWHADDGSVMIDRIRPIDVSDPQLIINNGPNELLVLTERQAVALGLPQFDGSARDLGPALEIDDWTEESRYGYDAMANVAEQARKQERKARVEHAEAVEKNVARREYVERYIEQALKQAAEWDPQQGDYATYSRRWRWGWGDGGYYRRGYEPGSTWTQESQREWRDRSDTTIRYLTSAARGVREAAKLDQEAVELGLDPTFAPGELAFMADDIQAKYDQVVQNRNRRRQ